MKSDFQSKAEKFWNRTASSYDREERKDKKTFLQIVEKTKPYIKPTDSILDFGCGTGLFSLLISDGAEKIDAIDLSSKMIEIAKTKAEKQNIGNIKFSKATIFDENLKEASYDVILCFYILHLLEEPLSAMNRIYYLLKPDGIIISVTPCLGEKPLQSSLFSILSKTGIIPRINFFRYSGLEQLHTGVDLHIETSERLDKTTQYFMVAKK